VKSRPSRRAARHSVAICVARSSGDTDCTRTRACGGSGGSCRRKRSEREKVREKDEARSTGWGKNDMGSVTRARRVEG